MGLFDSAKKAIMGDSGGGETVNNPDKVWKVQEPYLKGIYGTGQNMMNQQLASGSQFQQQFGDLSKAWQSQLAGAQNPYLTGMASNAMNQISRQFNEQIMPSLLGAGNQAGQLGGQRWQQMQDSAVRAAAEGMGSAANEVYGRAWDSGLAAQSQAIGQGSQVMNTPWNPILNQAAVVGNPTVLGQGGSSETTNPSEGLLSIMAKGAAASKGG
jgi:hypothetical protein